MNLDVSQFFVRCDTPIREVLACIDRTAKGIVLVVDAERQLRATITDGDMRRAILTGCGMESTVQTLLDRPDSGMRPKPITAPVGTPPTQLIALMNRFTIRHIPLLDEHGRVVDVALLNELVKEFELPLQALVMAGGFGTRLMPLTEHIPKPLVRVGDKPLLEVIIEQLRKAGIRRVNLATHHKEELIADHFGDGKDFGVEIQYVHEGQPLGTAGALGLLAVEDDPLLVVNGDILTQVDFRAMLDFHREHQADMTVAVRLHETRVSYGVVQMEGVIVTGVTEKPTTRHFINAGLYLINPAVCRAIPADRRYDMTDLISQLVSDGRQVVGFPVREYWIDIGQLDDHAQAQEDVRSGRVVL